MMGMKVQMKNLVQGANPGFYLAYKLAFLLWKKMFPYILINHCNVKSLVTLGDRSFQCAAPKLWNCFPIEIRNCPTLDSFKKSLKMYLFKEAFES